MMRIAEWADFPEDNLYDTMLDQEIGYQLIIDDRKGRFESLTGDDAADAVLQYLREEVSMKAIFNPADIVLMRNGGATVIHRNDRLFTGEIEEIAIYDRLPEPQEGVLYIVRQEVAEAADGRDDLAYPHFELVKKGLVAVTEPHKPAR